MGNIYNTVIQATIFGSIVGIIIFALKSTVLKKLPAKWQYLLWSVMIIKLIFPKGPESNISVFNRIKVNEIVSETELLKIAEKASPVNISEGNAFNILPYIWLAGFIIVLMWTVLSFVILNFKIRSSLTPEKATLEILKNCKEITGVKRNIKLVVQNHISTTALCGIFKPKILITKDFEGCPPSHIECTFIHELSHYKRGDIAMNYLLLFLRCVHWFNPVVWFLFRKIRRDTELATDERAMLYLKPAEHKKYGMTLINTLAVHSDKSATLLGMANNKKDIKNRIKAVARFKKPSFFQHISGILTIMLIASVCLTSAVIAKPITNMIYEKIPEVTLVSDNKGSFEIEITENTERLPPAIEKAPPKEDTDEAEDIPLVEEEKKEPAPKIEASTKDTKTEVFEENTTPPQKMTVDYLIKSTGQNLHSGTDTADMKKYAKLISYNSDSKDRHYFILKSNEDGTIQIFIEEQENYNYMIPVNISNIKTPGYGWEYGIYSDNDTPFYIDGLDPDEEYIVFIDTYCPGYYGIESRILIY